MAKHISTLVVILLLQPHQSGLSQQFAEQLEPPTFPYPRSDRFGQLTMTPSRQSIGHGDNWANTWADDNRLYAFFTDGVGFGLHTDEVSTAPVVIDGQPPNLRGSDIDSASGTIPYPAGQASPKVSGLLMVDGVLYAWLRNLNAIGQPLGTGAAMMYSDDRGKSWKHATWTWPSIGYPVWMNAGKNYSQAKDRYAYFISPDGPSAYADYPEMLMGRVPVNRMLDKKAYEFFQSRSSDGSARWGEFASRQPVLKDTRGIFRPDLIYNPGIDRYMLLSCSPYGDWSWWANDNLNRKPHLTIFDAPNPWGPWTILFNQEDWGEPENRFAPHIPTNWISEDVQTFYLLYSCIPNGPYQFNLQRCTLRENGEGLTNPR